MDIRIENLNNQTSPMRTALPETALLLAILERAVRDYLAIFEDKKYGQVKFQVDAKEWLWHEELEPFEPWGYHWICDHLDIEPEMVRKRIKKLFNTEEPYRGGGGKMNQLNVVSNLVLNKDIQDADIYHVKLSVNEIQEIYTKTLKNNKEKRRFNFNPYRGAITRKRKSNQTDTVKNQSRNLSPLTRRNK
jgi:hypothetical protein